MWISRYVCLFLIYSFLGWIYETIYCTILDGKWENRGFLYGPVVPIYGTGAVAVSFVVHFSAGRGVELSPWQIYIISVLGSAVLEYTTSWGMEKLFHALWWDYSSLPLSLHGRISLFTSLGFGLAGLLLAYAVVPFFEGLMNCVPSIVVEWMSLCLTFLFAVDITVTVTALYHFDQIVIRAEASFNQSMTALVGGMVQRTDRMKQGLITKRTSVMDEISSMSGIAKKALHRVAVFRDKNKRVEDSKNRLLSGIKRIGRKLKNIPKDE